jgi:hypothetical protein
MIYMPRTQWILNPYEDDENFTGHGHRDPRPSHATSRHMSLAALEMLSESTEDGSTEPTEPSWFATSQDSMDHHVSWFPSILPSGNLT